MRSQCVPATQACGSVIITNDFREVYTVTCGSVIVATPPTAGVGATPYRTVYIVLPQTSRPPTPLGQQVTVLNGSSVSAPLHIIVMGIKGGRKSARTLADLGNYTVTMRTPQLGPNFTGTFYYAGYRWLQSLSPTPYTDTSAITSTTGFQLFDDSGQALYYGMTSFEFTGPGVGTVPTLVTVSTSGTKGTPTPIVFTTALTSSGSTYNGTVSFLPTTGFIPPWTGSSTDYPGTAYMLTSSDPSGPTTAVPMTIKSGSSQYYFGITCLAPPQTNVYLTGCFNAVPRLKITTNCLEYVPDLATSAFGSGPSGLTVNVTSYETAQLTFPYGITRSNFNVPSLSGKENVNGFAILFDGTGAYSNSLNYKSSSGKENILSQSVVFGMATLAIILYDSSNEYKNIQLSLRNYLTPQLGTVNAATGINYQDFGPFTGNLSNGVLGSLSGFRLPGIGATTAFQPCAVTTQTLAGAVNYFVTIPQSNFLVFPGGLLLGSSAASPGLTYFNLLPEIPTGYTADSVTTSSKLLSIPAMTTTTTPSLLTDGTNPVVLSGMNRPGTEWSPIGWYVFESSGSLAALVRQLTTMHSTGTVTPATGTKYDYVTYSGHSSAITSWNGWCSNTLRIPLNQQFWLQSVSINGTLQVPSFSYSAGQYNSQYQALIEQIILVGRSVGIAYFILDLHWSDCGLVTASHVQSPNGLPCTQNFGNLNGIYGNIGQQMLPDTNSVAFWSSVAQKFDTTTYPDVLFELYNEPFPFQDPNSPPGPNRLFPYDVATNGNQIWSAWRDGPPVGGLPTRPLFKPDGSCNDGTAPLVIVPRGVYTVANTSTFDVEITTPGYVGMQDLLDVVHTISPGRVCIVGGVQFSYRLDGVIGGGATGYPQFQYALQNLDRNGLAANVLYNAHPYTSQLAPNVQNYADFETAFGMAPSYTDIICTEYGNNQGVLVGSSVKACDGSIQADIQNFIDGKTVTSVKAGSPSTQVTLLRNTTPYAASYTAWAWHAGFCDFPSMIGTNVYDPSSSNVYDYVAFETGTSVSWPSVDTPGPGGVPCMGLPVLASLQTRAGQVPITFTSCTGAPEE
jgi:hypothetical protein